MTEESDRELWRETEGDYYADSIHVTKAGGIGINCGGTVFLKPPRYWHILAEREEGNQPQRRETLLEALADKGIDPFKVKHSTEPNEPPTQGGP
jgi:hypothetical protein